VSCQHRNGTTLRSKDCEAALHIWHVICLKEAMGGVGVEKDATGNDGKDRIGNVDWAMGCTKVVQMVLDVRIREIVWSSNRIRQHILDR